MFDVILWDVDGTLLNFPAAERQSLLDDPDFRAEEFHIVDQSAQQFQVDEPQSRKLSQITPPFFISEEIKNKNC